MKKDAVAAKYIMVDPPSGWQYGFPKACPSGLFHNSDTSLLREWLIREGYPSQEVDFGMQHLRIWAAK